MDIGTLKATIEANHREFMAAITDMKQELKNVGSEAKKTGNDFDQLNNALSALGAGVAFNKISGAIKATVNEANKMQMAMQGLIEVTKSLNQDVEASTGLAQELASKGFMSVTEAAESVKTSLAMGLGLEETKNLVIALGDAAAYNRESHLGWGEAVVQAIRGIKMGESTLTDAAGITTNLSIMYERYADKIGTTAEKLTDAQKVQAAYNGMLQDAALFAGNAESALDGYQGSTARFNKSMSELKAEVGEAFMPIIADTLDALTPIIIELAKWASENEKLVVTIGGVSLGVTALISLLTAGAFAFNTLRTAAIGFQASLGPVGWVMAGLSIAATGLTVAYTNMADKTNEAKQAQEQYNLAAEQSAAESMNLAKEYDYLSNKLQTLDKNTEDAKNAKTRMAEIMAELQRISPNLISQYNSQAGAITNVANSFTVARKEAIEYAKALLQARIGSANIRLGHVQEDLMNNNDFLPFNRRKLRQEQTSINEEISNYEKQLAAVNKIEESYKKAETTPYNPSFTVGGGSGSSTDKKKKSTSKEKTTEDIARENYQESLRWVQYKKNLNDLSVEDELAAYERLLNRYKQYNDIRMDMEEKIYQTKGVMVQNSFEHSSEWIEKEEMRMRLSGKTDQEVAQMKIDAWERVKARYAENTDYYKQADRELYNLRLQMLREQEQVLEELQRDEEEAFKNLKDNIIDSIKDAKSEELEAIKKAKDADIKAIKDREREELASLDRRRQEIEDFYDNQLDVIDEQERAEEKAKIIADIEKYQYATSKEGREKYQELQEKLQEIERNEQRDHLREQKEQEIRNLDDRKENIEDFYDQKERETNDHYDREYETVQVYYDELLEKADDYTGDVIGLEELIADSRISLNASANSQILSQIRTFVDEYNAEMSRIDSERDDINIRVNDAMGNKSTDGNTFTGWNMNDGNIKYSVDANGYIYKNGNFVPASNYKWIPDEVVEKAGNIKKGIFHFGRDAITGLNFSSKDQLMPDEIAAILQNSEYVFQQGQLDSLISAVGQNKGQTVQNNYNAPLFEHSGDVNLEDQAEIRGWMSETERLVTRLRANGKKGGL